MSYFRTIKEAFGAAPESSLEALGVQTARGKQHRDGWRPVNCPCCSDSNGSASINSNNGFLRCQQCDRKLDLFEWWAELRGVDLWAAAVDIGARLGVKKPSAKKASARAGGMTEDILSAAKVALLEDPEAEWARKEIKRRKLWDPQLLASLDIGFYQGSLIFAQRFPNGEVKSRYQTWTTNKGFRWAGKGLLIHGFWPHWEDGLIPKDAGILLCEGNWDVLAAVHIGKATKRNWVPVTWTGGASSPVQSKPMPKDWHGRNVRIVYDVNVFQHADWKKHKAPDEKKKKEMWRRRENLIHGVAKVFAANECKVELAAVPLDPIDCWTGDLRDWLTQGRTIEELPIWKLEDLVDPELDPIDVADLKDLADHMGDFVRVRGSVQAIGALNLTIPKVLSIECPIASKSTCTNCGIPTRFYDQRVDMTPHRDSVLQAFCSGGDAFEWIKKNVFGKPVACNECKLHRDDWWKGAYWTMTGVSSVGLDQIPVVSIGEPSFSGEVLVTGYVFPAGNGVGIFATRIEQQDKPHFDVEQFHNQLLQVTPWASNDSERIWSYLDEMLLDYEHNVTHIYGRPEIHLTALLVAHSVLHYRLKEGSGAEHLHRGWLDACNYGLTRAGKSEAIKRLFEHWGVGQAYSCMENFSRAGLTVGGAQSGMVMQPGLFPKSNGRMLFLDELHHMRDSRSGEHPMVTLQSARDEGKISALKIYGNTKLQAAVRLITVGNWFNNNPKEFRNVCQHLLPFYGGAHESLARLDFAWCVREHAEINPRDDVPHVWTPELSRALILRAWAMEPHQVHFDPGVLEIASQRVKEWDAIYATAQMPLHTGREKVHSLIRQAIAVANMCYSHPKGQEADCLVRRAHMEVAIQWLVRCWENLEYDAYSKFVRRSMFVEQPFMVEALLTVVLNLGDPSEAELVLGSLSESQDFRQLFTDIVGQGSITDPGDFGKWFAQLRRLGAFERSYDRGTSFVRLTPGAAPIVANCMRLAAYEPDDYVSRFRTLEQWFHSPESRSSTRRDPPLEPFTSFYTGTDDDCPF